MRDHHFLLRTTSFFGRKVGQDDLGGSDIATADQGSRCSRLRLCTQDKLSRTRVRHATTCFLLCAWSRFFLCIIEIKGPSWFCTMRANPPLYGGFTVLSSHGDAPLTPRGSVVETIPTCLPRLESGGEGADLDPSTGGISGASWRPGHN